MRISDQTYKHTPWLFDRNFTDIHYFSERKNGRFSILSIVPFACAN